MIPRETLYKPKRGVDLGADWKPRLISVDIDGNLDEYRFPAYMISGLILSNALSTVIPELFSHQTTIIPMLILCPHQVTWNPEVLALQVKESGNLPAEEYLQKHSTSCTF